MEKPKATNAEFWEKVVKTIDYHIHRTQHKARGLWWRVQRIPAVQPVFVVGCSRAGTTLVYKTLSISNQIGSLNRETHDYWQSLQPLEQRNWSSHVLTAEDGSLHDRDEVSRYFYAQTGFTRFVDKNNQNGLCVNYLSSLFPDAHFVYVKRSPGDNINSLMEGWRRPDEFATWSENLPYDVAIEGGSIRRWCFFLPDGWQKYLNASLEEVCAFQYESINRAIMDAGMNIPDEQWHEVHYEDLVKDPVSTFQKIYGGCGLDFTDEISRHCKTVLSRPYNAFSSIELDKWLHSQNREKILRVLPNMIEVSARMGYKIQKPEIT